MDVHIIGASMHAMVPLDTSLVAPHACIMTDVVLSQTAINYDNTLSLTMTDNDSA